MSKVPFLSEHELWVEIRAAMQGEARYEGCADDSRAIMQSGLCALVRDYRQAECISLETALSARVRASRAARPDLYIATPGLFGRKRRAAVNRFIRETAP